MFLLLLGPIIPEDFFNNIRHVYETFLWCFLYKSKLPHEYAMWMLQYQQWWTRALGVIDTSVKLSLLIVKTDSEVLAPNIPFLSTSVAVRGTECRSLPLDSSYLSTLIVTPSFWLCLSSCLVMVSSSLDQKIKLCDTYCSFYLHNFLGNLTCLCLLFLGYYCNNITDICATWWQRISQPKEVWSWTLSGWEWQV